MTHLADLDVAILAGGLGTRLHGVLPDTPKILAPIAGKTFLDHLLGWLAGQGARRVVLCLGYRAADVCAYLAGRRFSSLQIDTVTEPEPLGTAGGVAFAFPCFRSDPVLVMNGDTIIDVNLNAFLTSHDASRAEASMVCARVENAARYGRVEIGPGRRVIRFAEKDPAASAPAWINAGIYLFTTPVLQRIVRLAKGSLEHDILEKMPPRSIHAFQAEGGFLDIGTPETLAVAPEMLTKL